MNFNRKEVFTHDKNTYRRKSGKVDFVLFPSAYYRKYLPAILQYGRYFNCRPNNRRKCAGSRRLYRKHYLLNSEDAVRKSFAASILISSAVAIITTVFSVLLTRPLLELLQTPAEIIDDATAYLVIIFLGIPATILFNLLSNAVRALGDSKTPLYFLIFACCVNIVLDLVFILYFHLGVAGAGIATILSQLLSGILCIFFIIKKDPILR